MRIAGAVALVTGASSGIGRATAIRLAEAGAQVIIHGRDRARLSALADKMGGTALIADLADPSAAHRLAQAALDIEGRVDIVVNNAGVGWAGPIDAMPARDVERIVAVNLTAPIELTKALLPAMRAKGNGYLMFVTSIAAHTGVSGEAVYAATKAGLDVFAESLRLELHGTGVGVGVLAPGVVDTPFFERRGRPYARDRPRPITAERVADVLVKAVAAGHAERYVPAWLRLPVAVRGVAPGFYRRLAQRFGGS
jgi:short-subunit dehydrogenase